MLKNKIKSLRQLQTIRAGLKRLGKRVVFTNGCFDILHYGHVKYLQDAKARGDVLIVAVNSDASIRRIKGKKRPIVGQADRAAVIAALASVDYVTVFSGETPRLVIAALLPDILVKGGDWRSADIVGGDIVHARGGRVATIPLAHGRSTTKIIEKIIAAY